LMASANKIEGEFSSHGADAADEGGFADFRNKGFECVSIDQDSMISDAPMMETPRKRSIESLRPPPRDMPPSLSALELKEFKSTIGLYGIGMKINTEVPHVVRQVTDLQDESGNSLNHEVQVGDVLILVDNQPIHNLDLDALERSIFGEQYSLVALTLKSKHPGNVKQLRVRRHVLVRTFESCRRFACFFHAHDTARPPH
jgi:hypothetical protein